MCREMRGKRDEGRGREREKTNELFLENVPVLEFDRLSFQFKFEIHHSDTAQITRSIHGARLHTLTEHQKRAREKTMILIPKTETETVGSAGGMGGNGRQIFEKNKRNIFVARVLCASASPDSF